MKTKLLIIIGIVAVGVIGIVILNHYISVEREFELNNTPDDLKGIFGNCKCQEDPERTCMQTFIDWGNSTHYIDNNICEWRLLENYPNSDKICIPGQYVENNEHRIRNGTHIYNNDACMWEILEICTGYCGEKENEN